MSATYLVSVTYINERFFDSLPKEYRAHHEGVSEAGRLERARTISSTRPPRSTSSAGVRAVHLTQGNRDRFVKALQPLLRGAHRAGDRQRPRQRIRKTGDAPAHPGIPSEFAQR